MDRNVWVDAFNFLLKCWSCSVTLAVSVLRRVWGIGYFLLASLALSQICHANVLGEESRGVPGRPSGCGREELCDCSALEGWVAVDPRPLG